jgi:hypothetical protein
MNESHACASLRPGVGGAGGTTTPTLVALDAGTLVEDEPDLEADITPSLAPCGDAAVSASPRFNGYAATTLAPTKG